MIGRLLFHGFLAKYDIEKLWNFISPTPGFLHPLPRHLTIRRTEGVSVHRIPKPINKVDGHGRCNTVEEKGGVRVCIGRGVLQGGGSHRGFGGNEGGGSAKPRYHFYPRI